MAESPHANVNDQNQSGSDDNSSEREPDYEVIRLIGRGNYGEVYLARDLTGAYRAVKVIYRETFHNERPYEREYAGIRKFAPLSRVYESQVKILHVGRRDREGYFYYIMELADDVERGSVIDPESYRPRTIRSEMDRRGRIPPGECVEIGMALAAVLENLHRNDLIHRDVKPSNVIFVDGVPKLADIGLVTGQNLTLSYVGTEGFIPPEGPGSVRADVFSLGKVLYEMSTGHDRLEFPILPADLDDDPDREPLLELNAVVTRACHNDPKKRYGSAREMFADLVRIHHGESVRRNRLNRTRAASAAIAGLLALVLLVIAVLQHDALRRLPFAEFRAGFKPLFNGKDVDGWTGHPRFWTVDQGVLHGRLDPDWPPGWPTSLIWTNPLPESFELRFQARVHGGSVRLICRAAIVAPSVWRATGVSVNLAPREDPRDPVPEDSAGAWTDYVARVDADHLRLFKDGALVAERRPGPADRWDGQGIAFELDLPGRSGIELRKIRVGPEPD